MAGIAILKNRIMEYAWGSKTFIPELLGELSPAPRPSAEMWMGTHPKASSMALYKDKSLSLAELVAADPSASLGLSIAEKFSNNLPFLFKVLTSEKPLSIQAHPDKGQAEAGFIRENREKIALDDTNRNYRDNNHKPELICALEPLWALKGFREIREIIELGERTGIPAERLGTDILKNMPDQEGLKHFFSGMMNMEKDKKRRLLEEIMESIRNIRSFDPVFRWVERLSHEYQDDIGALSPLFLNLVRLKPMEAMYIPSGELHAYLEGSGLELMANSDNVLRGGLTTKHIDLPELLNILDFTPHIPEIMKPVKGDEAPELIYPVMAEEFMLSVIHLNSKEKAYVSSEKRSAEIIICLEGEAAIKDIANGDVLQIKRGTSMFIPASVKQYLIEGVATVYKASVPL